MNETLKFEATDADSLPAQKQLENDFNRLAVKTYDFTDANIAEIKKKTANLIINGVDDKEGYKVVKDSITAIKKIVSGTEKKRLELNRLFTKAINGKAAYIKAELTPVLAALQLQKDNVDNEVKRLKEEEAKRLEIQFMNRTNQLFEVGFSFNGQFYEIGDVRVSHLMAKSLSDEEFNQHIEEGKATALKIKQEEAEKLAKQEAERKELAELRRLKEEKELAEGKKFTVVDEINTISENPSIKMPEGIGSSFSTGPVSFEGFNKKIIDKVATNNGVSAEELTKDIPSNSNKTFTVPQSQSTMNPYTQGFDACRKAVIELFTDPTPRKRAEFIELINNLKP